MLKFSSDGQLHSMTASAPDGSVMTVGFAPTHTPIIPFTPTSLIMSAILYQSLLGSSYDPMGTLLGQYLKKLGNRCAAGLYKSAPEPDPYRWQRMIANEAKISSQTYRALTHFQAVTRSKPVTLPDVGRAQGAVHAGALMSLIAWLDAEGAKAGRKLLGRREFEYVVRNQYAKKAPNYNLPDFAWIAERVPESAREEMCWEEARDLSLPWFGHSGLDLDTDLLAESIARQAKRAPVKVQRRLKHEQEVAERFKPKQHSVWGEAPTGWGLAN